VDRRPVGDHPTKDAPATSPPAKRRRVPNLTRWLFDHRADLLAALVYGCLAYLSFNALAEYANTHRLFPLPYGGWAFAVAIDMTVLFAFISFKRAPWLAGILLVSGAASTYTLQRWHAEGALHPLMVAGVVPGLMVLITFTWHRIKAAEARPDWPIPVPQNPAPEDVPPKATPPGPVQPAPVPPARPRPTQDVARTRGRPVGRGRPPETRPWRPEDAEQVRVWYEQDGRTNRTQMAAELGLSNRGRAELGRYLNSLIAQNGHGGGS
jgi:hypothetical protein